MLGDPLPIPESMSVDRCINCGSTRELTDEHVMPRGLSGRWIIKHGSCKSCAKITSAFEMAVLRNEFLLPRTALRLPTYHPKNRPKGVSI